MKNYSAQSLNEAAKTGKVLPVLNKDNLEKAYNYYRDNGKLIPNPHNNEKLVLSVCSADYGDFLNNKEFNNWFTYNSHLVSYRKGLVGTLVGIMIFSDIFLEQHERVLRENTMFLLPKPDLE